MTNTKILKFGKAAWNKPVICKLAIDYGLEFSILKARVLPRQEGFVILEFHGTKKDVQKGLKFLRSAGVTIEDIEQEITRDESVCTHCGSCTGFCPSGALRIEDRSTMRVEFHPEDCIGCELCIRGCPPRAMNLSTEMAAFESEFAI